MDREHTQDLTGGAAKSEALPSVESPVAPPVLPSRSCGECKLCCTALSLHERGTRADGTRYEFAKPMFAPCAHECAKGCAVYSKPEKPYACRTFRCAWLEGCGPEEARPDKIGAVVSFGDIDQSPFTGRAAPVTAVHAGDSTPFFGNGPILKTLWDLAQKYPALGSGYINVWTPRGTASPHYSEALAVDYATGASVRARYLAKDPTYIDQRAEMLLLGMTEQEIEAESIDLFARVREQLSRESRTERRARERRARKHVERRHRSAATAFRGARAEPC